VAFGFQFLLGHPDGVPADPGMLVTAMPSWKVRDGERSTFFYWERGTCVCAIASRHGSRRGR
jgi:hypothetical protein